VPGIFNARTSQEQQRDLDSNNSFLVQVSFRRAVLRTLKEPGDFVRRTSVFESGTFLYPTLARSLLYPTRFCSKKQTILDKTRKLSQKSARVWNNLLVEAAGFSQKLGAASKSEERGTMSELRAFTTIEKPLLTGREVEVLSLVIEGYSSKQVADMLFISKRTVDFHLDNIYGKLQVSNRMQALQKASRLGILAKAA